MPVNGSETIWVLKHKKLIGRQKYNTNRESWYDEIVINSNIIVNVLKNVWICHVLYCFHRIYLYVKVSLIHSFNSFLQCYLTHARTVMLAQSTDSGQLIASAVIKLFHAMKLPVQDLRGVGIQVQLLEGNQPVRHEATGRGARSIKDMLLGQRPGVQTHNRGSTEALCFSVVKSFLLSHQSLLRSLLHVLQTSAQTTTKR